MKKTLEKYRAKLRILEAFAEKYATGKLPGELMHPSLEYGNCGVSIHANSVLSPDEKNLRDAILSTVGDTFGRQGWTRRLSYDKRSFDWHQVIDGVNVTVHEAEPIHNPMDGTPVPTNAFPLLLEYTGQTAPEPRGIPRDLDPAPPPAPGSADDDALDY